MRKLTRNLLRGAAAMALCAAAGMSHATPVTFDIVFLLDASGSVGSAQFHSERQLINTIHDQFVALAPADHSVNYRFGVIEFATTASVIPNAVTTRSMASSRRILSISTTGTTAAPVTASRSEDRSYDDRSAASIDW